MSTKTIATHYRTCLDCPRTIPSDSDEMRCPGCKAGRVTCAWCSDACVGTYVVESDTGGPAMALRLCAEHAEHQGFSRANERSLAGWLLTETRERRTICEDDIAACTYGPSRGPRPWPVRTREEEPCPF